ncbi:MAG: hypothetical protein IJN37_05765 [Clostridia bacterium]|nr:hypothetical protein [Clostridia bacterium]
MKQQDLMGKIMVFVIMLVFLAYLGYHLYTATGSQIETIDAVSVTAVDKIVTSGVFIRDQYPIEWKSNEMSEFLVEDGEKVSNGQSVALLFSDESSREQYSHHKELTSRLEVMKEGGAYLFDVSDSAKLSLLIKSAVSEYTDAQISGNISEINDATYQLNSLIDLQKNNISTQEEYDNEIAALESEIAKYKNAAYSGSYIKSNKAGYFFKASDGFDERYTIAGLETLSCDDIKEAVDQKDAALNYSIGKIVSGFEWYFAVEINDAQVKKLNSHSEVILTFPHVSTKEEPAELVEIRNEGDGRNLAIFKCTHMDGNLLSNRTQQAEIILGTYTGIKIPKTSIRQVGGKWGVYCLVGEKSVFKEIEWLFETDSYYLVEQAESIDEGLFEYDKIIISGNLS